MPLQSPSATRSVRFHAPPLRPKLPAFSWATDEVPISVQTKGQSLASKRVVRNLVARHALDLVGLRIAADRRTESRVQSCQALSRGQPPRWYSPRGSGVGELPHRAMQTATARAVARSRDNSMSVPEGDPNRPAASGSGLEAHDPRSSGSTFWTPPSGPCGVVDSPALCRVRARRSLPTRERGFPTSAHRGRQRVALLLHVIERLRRSTRPLDHPPTTPQTHLQSAPPSGRPTPPAHPDPRRASRAAHTHRESRPCFGRAPTGSCLR